MCEGLGVEALSKFGGSAGAKKSAAVAGAIVPWAHEARVSSAEVSADDIKGIVVGVLQDVDGMFHHVVIWRKLI